MCEDDTIKVTLREKGRHQFKYLLTQSDGMIPFYTFFTELVQKVERMFKIKGREEEG